MSDIIRCKDCSFYTNKHCSHKYGMCKPDPEDFCSRAKKKFQKLKSCPFCGNNVSIIYHENNDKYGISCIGCNVSIGTFDTKDELVETWNRRFY